MVEDPRELGIVKFYNPRKGYGFVTRSDGSDVFFHLTHLRVPANPAPGHVVQFLLGQNREGLTAEDICLVAPEVVEVFEGRITSLGEDGGLIMTPDDFEVRFRRSDFLPHARADSLRVGDEVEMHFLLEDGPGWRAAVVRPANWTPEPISPRPERREVDDEEENRRLLGILYKTDLDDEAQHAAGLLAERNMRASLSALVSRVFDRRLSPEVRRELLDRCGQLYFDDESALFLTRMVAMLGRTLDEEDLEQSPAAVEALQLLLDDEAFPQRWTQYLLPFGLSLWRNLAAVPGCHSLLEHPEMEAAAERWLARLCRHVEQRRSGHGYVLTTALTTFDDFWQRDLLHAPIRRALARLLTSLDAEGLGSQFHHLRDRLSAGFLAVLAPALVQHPDLPLALGLTPGNAEVFAGWVEVLLSGEQPADPELLAVLLPLLQDLRSRAADQEMVERLMAPVTSGLTATEVLRLLSDEDLPERSGWACLWHLQTQGELQELLGDPQARTVVTSWLSRAAERATPAESAGQDLNTALKLVESLKESEELRSELVDIGANLFAGVHQRLAAAGSGELLRMLDQFAAGELPGLTATLIRKLAAEDLDEAARRRAVAWLLDLGPLYSDLATAILVWRRAPEDREALNDLITALQKAEDSSDPEAAACGQAARELLRARDITWHEGFVTAIAPGPDGQPRARVEGFAILLPPRLFADRLEFAPNRQVRLLLRRGLALGVTSAPVAEAGFVCGRLEGPLMIDDRDAVVGILVDLHGQQCYFEVASMKSGQDRALAEGDLLRFTRLAAVGDQPFAYVAFNVHAAFGPEDLSLLLETVALATDEGVAAAAARQAMALAPAGAELWPAAWRRLDDERRRRLLDSCGPEQRQQLSDWVGAA
jgi:CspA family cold shock protein